MTRCGVTCAPCPALLDRVDALIAEGVIGGHDYNVADFQIATSVRLLMTLEDLRGAIEPRPAARARLAPWCRASRAHRAGASRAAGLTGRDPFRQVPPLRWD